MTPPLLLVAPAAPALNQSAAALGSVVASVTSGITLGGVIIGIIAGLSTVVSLAIFAAVTVRKGRKDYAQEIRDAEARGAAGEKRWSDYYKDMAEGRFRLPPRPEDDGS